MISLKSSDDVVLMKRAGVIVRDTLALLEENVRVGVTTAKLDRLAFEYITKCGAKPSFLGYMGYPASICASINEEVVHGIPNPNRILKEGDIVSIDIGAYINGFHADAARTFPVGKVSKECEKLMRVCKESYFKGVEQFKEGLRLGDIGEAIQTHAESNGFGVVRKLVGHGIGREMHEDPNVPNYGVKGHGLRLRVGMALAIEPMINMGTDDVYQLDDGWTIVTADDKPSAHYENTVILTSDGVVTTTL